MSAGDGAAAYEEAERALLRSEGVEAAVEHVDLPRLGGRLRVLLVGEGPLVLFVPGVMTTGAVFAGLVGRLSGFRCVLVDRPGTGSSSPVANPPTTLTAQQAVADALLVDVLDGLDADTASVVATSLGGWYAFRSAAAHPERFERIAGLGFQGGARIAAAPLALRFPTPGWLVPPRLPATRKMVRSLLRQAGMGAAIRSGAVSDELLDWMVALLRHTSTFRNESRHNPRPIGLRGPVAAVRHSPELLGRISAPVLLAWGTDDPFGGADAARELASLLPSATVELIEGAGHAPWLDAPDRVAAAVQHHLADPG